MSGELEKLLTADEVARILNISLSMAYALMQRGDIKVVRLGRSVRVRPADLREFIEQKTERGFCQ